MGAVVSVFKDMTPDDVLTRRDAIFTKAEPASPSALHERCNFRFPSRLNPEQSASSNIRTKMPSILDTFQLPGNAQTQLN